MSPEDRADEIANLPGSPLQSLIEEAIKLGKNPLFGHKTKRHHITRVATQFSEFIVPLTACKSGCSHCCNMATAISQEEADVIGEYIGKKPERVVFDMEEFHRREGYRDVYTGVPCTFLGDDGSCTIYEVRPITCRLHHSLEDTPDHCKIGYTGTVLTFNVFDIHNAFINATSMMAEGGSLGDIRQFFPHDPARRINPASVVPTPITEEMLSCGTDSIVCWP